MSASLGGSTLTKARLEAMVGAIEKDPLKEDQQMASLVEAVTHQRLAYACPHGRPTHVTLSLAELERRFLRLTPSPERGQGEG